MQNPSSASATSPSRRPAAGRPAPALNSETHCLPSFQKKDLQFSTPPHKPASALRSPESKHETLFSPSFQQKDVLLTEWWLMKTEKGYNGKRLAVGGFTKRREAVGIFNSAPIVKRHDDYTLETADGITVRIQGPINKARTSDNGFPLKISAAFLFGFPTNWDTSIEESSGGIQTHQPETIFDPSTQKKTVLLRNWWLRRAEKASDGSMLAIGGFSEWGKAMRIFNSSAITKRHDVYTLETADGVTIRIQGFINKTRTLDNGFPQEACKIFFIGFPTTWMKFANCSSGDKPSYAETPLNISIGADRYEDFLENLPTEVPVHSENTNLENVPSTSKTSVRDFAAILREATRKFVALGSMPSSVHLPLVHEGSQHLPAKKICDNNCAQVDKICGTNVTYAQTVGKDYKYHEAEHTPANNCSTEAFNSKEDGCQISNLHVDGLPQEISVDHGKLNFIQEETLKNSKKCSGHTLAMSHHDELARICSTGVSSDSGIGKDFDKQEETLQKKDEKFYECSTGRKEKVRSGLTKPENLHSENQKFAEFSAKPARRSKRLMLQKVGNFQSYSWFLNETDKMDCAKLAPDGSKTSPTSQAKETLVERNPLPSTSCREDQIFCESPAEPVSRGERFELLTVGNVHGESQEYSQFLNETNNVNCANLPPDGSKISAISEPNDVLVKGRPFSPNRHGKIEEFVSSAKPASGSERLVLAPDGSKTDATSMRSDIVLLSESILSLTKSICFPSVGVSEENQVMSLEIASKSNSVSKCDSASTACLWKNLNDQKTLSCDPTTGLVEESSPNSKAFTSSTLGKNMMRHCMKIKNNQTVRSRMRVEQNDSRNQQHFTSTEENMSISSASNSRRKAGHQTPLANKSLHIRTNYKITKSFGVSRNMGKSKRGSHASGYKTVWVSSYTDVHRAPLTQCKGNDLSFLTPESLSLKRSRSGRLLIPTLDCSTRIIYEADGSIAGTASVDGSVAGTPMMVMPSSQGSRMTPNGRKRQKQQ